MKRSIIAVSKYGHLGSFIWLKLFKSWQETKKRVFFCRSWQLSYCLFKSIWCSADVYSRNHLGNISTGFTSEGVTLKEPELQEESTSVPFFQNKITRVQIRIWLNQSSGRTRQNFTCGITNKTSKPYWFEHRWYEQQNVKQFYQQKLESVLSFKIRLKRLYCFTSLCWCGFWNQETLQQHLWWYAEQPTNC